MTEHWKFIYLHTGDRLHVSRQGAQLGRKKSTKSILEVDDDLPGHQLKLGGTAGGSNTIYTLPHGSRAVQVIKKIDEEYYIEEGEKNSFLAPEKKSKKARNDELERGRIIVEETVYLDLEDLLNGTKKAIESAMTTSAKLHKKQLPNLRGKCGAQRVEAMEIYRRTPEIRLQFSSGPDDADSIEEVLRGIISTRNPKAYIDNHMIMILEFMIMNEVLSTTGFDIPGSDFKARFENLFEELEALGFESWFVLPICSITTRQELLGIVNEMVFQMNFTSLYPFIDTMSRPRNIRDISFDEWMAALNELKFYFPSHSSLDWMESQEGNDVAFNSNSKKTAEGNIWLDLFSILIDHVNPPQVPQQYENLGICLRDAATFHHGSRVVCDRMISNPSERSIRSCIDMYDSNWNPVCNRIDVSNGLSLTHDNTPIEYSNARWMVIRLGNLSPQYNTVRFSNPEEFYHLERELRPNNPWEAFVTLPWFITYDAKRKSRAVGVLDVCSQQLVHAHFIDTIHHDEAYVVIPVQVRSGDGFKITQNTPLRSTTTICFRAMYSTTPNEDTEYQNREFECDATPHTRWWVERPSYLT